MSDDCCDTDAAGISRLWAGRGSYKDTEMRSLSKFAPSSRKHFSRATPSKRQRMGLTAMHGGKYSVLAAVVEGNQSGKVTYA